MNVLAGAYRGKRSNLDALLTHASEDDGSTAVCGNIAEGNLCDVKEPGPPTCKRCLREYNPKRLNELLVVHEAGTTITREVGRTTLDARSAKP